MLPQILMLIVNKLGDPARKTSAAAGHELRRVLKHHPSMQVVISREVQQLAHRNHLLPKSMYSCVSFLNQLRFERNDVEMAKEVIAFYFKIFEVAIGKVNPSARGANDVLDKRRLLSALLVGVNRAHPYLPERDQYMDEHIDELYRVVHTGPHLATQALLLLFHITVGTTTEQPGIPGSHAVVRQDRFYKSLYSSLASAVVISQGKHTTMFFNLLFKSIKHDQNPGRVLAFAKRLSSTAIHCNAPACAASIFLLNELACHHRHLRTYLEEIPEEDCSKVVLDPTKREPRAAMSAHGITEDGTPRSQLASSWELSLASHHYHPSVAKIASTVGGVAYGGNPFFDFSLAAFLNKFAYRNPKAVKQGSQLYYGGESVGARRELGIDVRLALPFNDPSFLKQKGAVEDDFFRR